jgi:hypothetical protein
MAAAKLRDNQRMFQSRLVPIFQQCGEFIRLGLLAQVLIGVNHHQQRLRIAIILGKMGRVAQAFKFLLLSLGMMSGAPSFALNLAGAFPARFVRRKGWEIITRRPSPALLRPTSNAESCSRAIIRETLPILASPGWSVCSSASQHTSFPF